MNHLIIQQKNGISQNAIIFNDKKYPKYHVNHSNVIMVIHVHHLLFIIFIMNISFDQGTEYKYINGFEDAFRVSLQHRLPHIYT